MFKHLPACVPNTGNAKKVKSTYEYVYLSQTLKKCCMTECKGNQLNSPGFTKYIISFTKAYLWNQGKMSFIKNKVKYYTDTCISKY